MRRGTEAQRLQREREREKKARAGAVCASKRTASCHARLCACAAHVCGLCLCLCLRGYVATFILLYHKALSISSFFVSLSLLFVYAQKLRYVFKNHHSRLAGNRHKHKPTVASALSFSLSHQRCDSSKVLVEGVPWSLLGRRSRGW